MNKITKIVIAIIATVVIAVGVIYYVQQSAYTKLTLPLGTSVPYGQQNINQYAQYQFNWGGVYPFTDNETLYVGAGNNLMNSEGFPVIQGSTYTAYGLQITILEIHPDYIVISVKQAS